MLRFFKIIKAERNFAEIFWNNKSRDLFCSKSGLQKSLRGGGIINTPVRELFLNNNYRGFNNIPPQVENNKSLRKISIYKNFMKEKV